MIMRMTKDRIILKGVTAEFLSFDNVNGTSNQAYYSRSVTGLALCRMQYDRLILSNAYFVQTTQVISLPVTYGGQKIDVPHTTSTLYISAPLSLVPPPGMTSGL